MQVGVCSMKYRIPSEKMVDGRKNRGLECRVYRVKHRV